MCFILPYFSPSYAPFWMEIFLLCGRINFSLASCIACVFILWFHYQDMTCSGYALQVFHIFGHCMSVPSCDNVHFVIHFSEKQFEWRCSHIPHVIPSFVFNSILLINTYDVLLVFIICRFLPVPGHFVVSSFYGIYAFDIDAVSDSVLPTTMELCSASNFLYVPFVRCTSFLYISLQ